ncbi:cytochrome P450 [Brevibacterium atlanticum]|uniref:cytochrome P450 n=1 Tax=Brevibacterium atlanticum TaxID=2697563 RepID=UPI001D191B2D|nr:cytochrome P450 [Brevibacterium atlanticum]
MSERKALRDDESAVPAVETVKIGTAAHAANAARTAATAAEAAESDRSMWRLRAFAPARQALRARGRSRQAGFTAEKIPRGLFRAHPILISDGPDHNRQRREVARFFAPAVIADRYGEHIAAAAQGIVDEAVVTGRCRLDEAALHFTVDVTSQVVGLTESATDSMAARLVAFFRQPPVDLAAENWGRTKRQWMQAAVNGIVPLLRFFTHDVRPAVRAHRREHRGDVISHLLDSGHSTGDILVECLTYGTAGMVTTREFIAMACWHLLENEELRRNYLAAEQPRRLSILEEIIRVEPVVGHLYRRATSAIEIGDEHDRTAVPAGDLVDVCVREANVDPEVYGADAEAVCPHRSGAAPAAGLSFGDGAHSCPGKPLALFETDALLHRLLACEPRLLTEPTVEWDDLIEGYRIRNIDLGFVVPARPARQAKP